MGKNVNSRHRGALLLLGALLVGRLLDSFDLPFERLDPVAAPDSTPRSSEANPDSLLATPAAAPGGEPSGDATAPAKTPAAPVAINRATAAELETLPGVGPVLALRIVAHRDAHGPFASLSDLERVRGLGPKSCARLASHVRFD